MKIKEEGGLQERVALSLGLGSILFLLQTLMMDSGTVISWTWTGYPISGPVFLDHAYIVTAAASAGLASGFVLEGVRRVAGIVRRPTSILWDLSACSACYVFTVYQDWIGFIGGCGLVFYLAFVFPSYAQAASRFCTASVLGWAMVLVVVLDVLSVLTVAYAFVPGGQYLRERTDVIMGFSMICICVGNWSIGNQAKSIGQRISAKSPRYRSRTTLILLALGSISLGSFYSSSYFHPAKEVIPYHPNNGVWTGGIWTVHFGVDEAGRDSQHRMVSLIRDMKVDVIGLLETDLHRFVYGNRDLTRMIREELGYYVDLGPGPNKHTWGAALLSKFPIVESIHHLLPSPHGELAPAIQAKLLIDGQLVNVVVSHNGQEEDPLDRQLQSEMLAKIMSGLDPEPVVFLGYLVTEVGASRPGESIVMGVGLISFSNRSSPCLASFGFFNALLSIPFSSSSLRNHRHRWSRLGRGNV